MDVVVVVELDVDCYRVQNCSLKILSGSKTPIVMQHLHPIADFFRHHLSLKDCGSMWILRTAIVSVMPLEHDDCSLVTVTMASMMMMSRCTSWQ